MMKCFICGKEYDEKNKPVAVKLRIRSNGQIETVKKVGFSDTNKIAALCPNCIKAAVFGAAMLSEKYEFADDIVYEPDETQ